MFHRGERLRLEGDRNKGAAVPGRLHRSSPQECEVHLTSAIGLYLVACDGEHGGHVVSAANTQKQAALVFTDSQLMARREKGYCARFGVEILAHTIVQMDTASKFEALSAEHSNLDGLNLHAALIDELHAHPTRGLWDVLATATGSRIRPLIWAIRAQRIARLPRLQPSGVRSVQGAAQRRLLRRAHLPLPHAAARPGDRVLARYDDGAVAALEKKVGAGRVIVWTSTLDDTWTDIAVKPVFLPLVHQLVRYLAHYEPATSWLTVGQVARPHGARAKSAATASW